MQNWTATEKWLEPTRVIPLQWGHYLDRYVLSLVLVISGTIGLQAATTNTLVFVLFGLAAFTIGWWIMPGRGWRRVCLVFPSGFAAVILLTGPQAMWVTVVPYLAWLVVRERPLRSYLTVLFVILNGVVMANLFNDYSGMPMALAITSAVIVGSAWIARYIAARQIPSEETY